MSPLRNRVVLITGAARGIGAETARTVAARGARVALVGLEPDRLKEVTAELGDGHAWFPCDVTDQDQVDAAVAATVDRFGRIDVVVTNAGVANHGTVAVSDPNDVARTIEVNLVGTVRTVGATLPHLEKTRGYCLLVASAAVFAALPGMAAYCASKAGVEQFGNALRLEVAHKKVGVGVAYMTYIDTDMVRDAQDEMPGFSESIRELPGPLGQVLPVRTCAEAFVHGIEHRSHTVHVPSALKRLHKLRGVFTGTTLYRLRRKASAERVPLLEEHLKTTGGGFGAHSMGRGRS